jgi:hypothetical protein
VVQQHQRQQPCDLLVIGHRRQLPGEPDRLGRQVDVAGVALVEDQVEHPQHRRQVAGLLEPHATDRAFGPADPLRRPSARHTGAGVRRTTDPWLRRHGPPGRDADVA